MIQTYRVGKNYSKNIIDSLLSFNEPSTWTVSSGTGVAEIDSIKAFKGNGSLKIETEDINTSLVVSNAVQSSFIPRDGKYDFSLYIYKEDEFSTAVLEVDIYKNGVKISADGDCIIGNSSDSELDNINNWVRYTFAENFEFLKDDEITFKFTLKDNDDDPSFDSLAIWIDGLMLFNKERLDFAPPLYNNPTTTETIANLYTGWGSYEDTTYTSGSPFTVIDGATAVDLPNNKGTAIESQIPTDITTFYDGTVITGRYGDGINLTIDFKCKPTTSAANPRLTVAIDIGGGIPELYTRDFVLAKGSGVEHNYLSSFNAYTFDTWEANGGTLKISADNDDIEVYDIRYVITRTHKAR